MPKKPAVKGPKGERVKPTTAAFVASYKPTNSRVPLVEVDQWPIIKDFVIGVVEPLTWMTENSIRSYLNAATRLAVWAQRQGLPLESDYLLRPDVIAAFEKSQEEGRHNVVADLARLGEVNGVSVDVNKKAKAKDQRAYQPPYARDEMDSLLKFAFAQTNEYRRGVLLSIIGLGAGVGAVRERMRGVYAVNVHQHEDGATYVRTATGCARVLDEFVDVLLEACRLRENRQLAGDRESRDLTTRSVSWVKDQVGVPNLHIDRLRATYICSLINSDVPLRQIVAWTGLETIAALGKYWKYCRPLDSSCQLKGPQ
jgi:hypothetical protein